MPARVMYVVDHLKFGGVQTHLVQLLSRLDRRRFAPMVCALKAHGELRPAVEQMGVPVLDGGLGRTLMGPGERASSLASSGSSAPTTWTSPTRTCSIPTCSARSPPASPASAPRW